MRRTLSTKMFRFCCIVSFVSCAGFLVLAPVDGRSTCVEDFYFDHGTGRCEHCSDICYKAQHKKTADTCQQLCPAYARKLARVVSPPGDNRDSNASNHLSTAAVLGIVAAAVVVSVAAFLAVLKRRAIMQTLWPAAPEQAGGGGEEEVHQPLPVGVPEEAPSPQQETVAGRCGNQQLALLAGSSHSDNMEPKTVHASANPFTTMRSSTTV